MATSVDPRFTRAVASPPGAPTPLVWTPVHSTAMWTGPPAPPRVVRAALTGHGWLVATEVAGGWTTTFVPDPGATDPPDAAASGSFQVAKVEWSPPVHDGGSAPKSSSPKRAQPPKPPTPKRAHAPSPEHPATTHAHIKELHVPEHHETRPVRGKTTKKHRASS